MSATGDLARRRAAAIWASDAASRGLGMELEHSAPEATRIAMTVRPDKVNGLDLCYGGFIHAVADSAMAFAAKKQGDRLWDRSAFGTGW